MEKKKKLFDLSYEDRRENFVRARFGQEDVFGREDAEEWLAKQWQAERPEMEDAKTSFWFHFMSLDKFIFAPQGMEREFLLTCASPLGKGETRGVTAEGPGVNAILRFASDYMGLLGKNIYWYNSDECELLVLGLNDRAGFILSIVAETGEEATLVMSVRGSWIMDVIFAEWKYQRPKWQAARDLFCSLASAVVARERAGAEADFYTAVACSADGRRIVIAQRVSVLGGDEKGEIYPAHKFSWNKILLGSRYNENVQLEDGQLYNQEQLFSRSRGVFFTHPKFVPK